jgi:hypothetical protein
MSHTKCSHMIGQVKKECIGLATIEVEGEFGSVGLGAGGLFGVHLGFLGTEEKETGGWPSKRHRSPQRCKWQKVEKVLAREVNGELWKMRSEGGEEEKLEEGEHCTRNLRMYVSKI